MNRLLYAAFLLASLGTSVSACADAESTPLPALPVAVSNNAVVAVRSGDNEFMVSFAGLGAGRGHVDTHARTFVYDNESAAWHETDAVPGGVGRLAAVAATAQGLAFVFGGYTVAEDGSEVSTPWVHAFDPATGTFNERQPMPVPVDDAVAVTYGERYIYLISGWHDLGNVNLVQRYDAVSDNWAQATPVPGRPVFGHAGGIVDNTIFYCDGVAIEPHVDRRRDFVANNECFAGLIDAGDTRRIDWRTVPAHPGPARYRMAAASIADLNAVVFIGGSDNPYNYDGIGYNGEPSQPSAGVLIYDLGQQSWREMRIKAAPTMDHRGLVEFDGRWVTIGGMLRDQQVTDRVTAYTFD